MYVQQNAYYEIVTYDKIHVNRISIIYEAAFIFWF